MRVLTKHIMDTATEPHDLLRETARSLFLDVDFPKLTEETRDICDVNPTEEEPRVALFSKENNKSPGVDGLSTNFYKLFRPLVSGKLLLVYNYAFEEACLSVSQRLQEER